MTNSLSETFPMPFRNFAALVVKYSKAQVGKSEAEGPRTMELRRNLEALVQSAKDQNLMLDDESVAASSEAARIRSEIDKILPEFQSLADAAAKRLAMTRHLRERVEAASRTPDIPVQVPIGEAMVLTELAEPMFDTSV